MITNSWLELFPLAKLHNLEGSSSEHSPILLEPKKVVIRKKQFHLENAWSTDRLVNDNWEGNKSMNIQQKIKICSEKLELWGREVTGKFGCYIKACKAQLHLLRNKGDSAALERFREVKKNCSLSYTRWKFFGGKGRSSCG